jgi:hypothetical protein
VQSCPHGAGIKKPALKVGRREKQEEEGESLPCNVGPPLPFPPTAALPQYNSLRKTTKKE